MTKEVTEFLEKNYNASDGGLTSMRSEGNGDDQFDDGFAKGYAVALKAIADLCGIKVEPLEADEEFNY